MSSQQPLTRRLKTTLKVLIVFLVVGVAVGLTGHKAYAATTPPAGIPSDIASYICNYNAAPPTANLYLDDSWISPTTNESIDGTDNDVTYGQTSVNLQVNGVIFLYQTLVNGGTGSCTDGGNNSTAPNNACSSGDTGAPLPCDGTPTSSAALTSQQEQVNSITVASGGGTIGPLSSTTTSIAANAGSRYWFNAPLPTFTYTPAGGAFTTAVTVTFTLNYTQINTFHGTSSACVATGQVVANPTDYGGCGAAGEAVRSFTLVFNPPSNIGNPPEGGWVAGCDELHGFAEDPDDPTASLSIQITNSATGYVGYVTANDSEFANPTGSNNGFSLPTWPAGALSSTSNNIITVEAENVTNEGEGIGFAPLNYNDTTSDTYVLGVCSNGSVPPQTYTTGSATCPAAPPTYDPNRLPFDPGENVAVTVGINYTPPSGQTGLPQSDATYTVYSQGNPAPTIELTEPSWWAGDTGSTTTTYMTPAATIPTTTPPGTFDTDWTFTWAVSEVTYHWTPPVGTTAGYYTPTLGTATGTKTCTWGGNSSGTPIVPGNPGNPGSVPQCVATRGCIAYYPYFRTYGGDISAGGDCSTGSGGIYGWPTLSASSSAWLGGAGTQFAEGALGMIQGSASAANVAAGTNPTPDTANGGAPTGLSFSNQPTASGSADYGGCSVSADTPDHTATYYYEQEPTSAADVTLWAGGPLSTPTVPATSDNYYTTGDVNITGGTINPGVHVKVYVQGNVEISGNIMLGSGATSTTDIPTFWVIATGSISVDDSVTRLDGVYAAEQSINTCNVATTDPDFYTECSKQLTVNGSLIADANIYLNRTFGTVSQSTADDTGTAHAAEIINFDPLIFLPTETALSSSYDAINSLPPVL